MYTDKKIIIKTIRVNFKQIRGYTATKSLVMIKCITSLTLLKTDKNNWFSRKKYEDNLKKLILFSKIAKWDLINFSLTNYFFLTELISCAAKTYAYLVIKNVSQFILCYQIKILFSHKKLVFL